MQINRFIRGIYSHDCFIPKDAALELSQSLSTFCKAYLFEADCAFKDKLPHFPLYPKLHLLHEVAFRLKKECSMASHALNPSVHCCALDEDFIGRQANITRTVSPMLISKRTLERYLAHIQIAWARGWFHAKAMEKERILGGEGLWFEACTCWDFLIFEAVSSLYFESFLIDFGAFLAPEFEHLGRTWKPVLGREIPCTLSTEREFATWTWISQEYTE